MDEWKKLNERQQTYLKAIYETDQEQEAWERGAWKRGGKPRKAEVWRWMDYATFDGVHTTLKMKLFLRELINEGTGSTFEALERRGLITCRRTFQTRDGQEVWPAPGESVLAMQLTTKGRKLVRQALDIKIQRRQPGTLTPKQQQYAEKIINAEIASREEVEAAFRDKSEASEERIRTWGSILSRIQRKEREEYDRTHPDVEHCAVCAKEILIYHSEYSKDKLPVRHASVEYEVPGMIWGAWSFNAKKKTDRYDYYGCCPEHEAIIKKAELKVTATLDFTEEHI